MNILYACIIDIEVPHEVKCQRAFNRTSQIMKNRQDVNTHMRNGTIGAPDRVNIPCLMHNTRLCHTNSEVYTRVTGLEV